MDFVGVTKFTLETSVDPMNGNAIITLKNVVGGATIAVITAEKYKIRPILDSLTEAAKNLYADPTVVNWKRHSVINVNESHVETTLSSPV
jgi:hypothetical protein